MHSTVVIGKPTLGTIGPYDPKFMKDAGAYLFRNPSPDQKQCLKSFFAKLRMAPVGVHYFQTSLFLLVHTCGVVVTMTTDGQRVVDIAPSTVP